MIILIGTLILAGILLLLIYFSHNRNDDGDLSVPYAAYGSYPIVGHLFSFLNNRKKLLMKCRQRYGECYRIKLFSQCFTMISSHADWMTVIRNPSFQFMGVDFAMKIFGVSSTFENQAEFDADAHRLYVQHLKNRDGLRPMVVEFVRRMRELMKNEKSTLEENGTASKWISSGLLEFSHRMLFAPSTLALLGEIDPPSLENDFRLFDSKFHYFFAPLPDWIYTWFLSKSINARSRLNKSWLLNRDPPGASAFHRDRLTLFSENSHWLFDGDYGSLLTSFFWASLGNTIPAVFWSLFYILRDAKAVETIKKEIHTHLPAIPLERVAEDWTPDQLDLCIYLESAINETLRLAGAPFLTRKCQKETQVTLQDGRTINFKPGETLAWFGAVSHFDPNLFPQPNEFIFDRFLNRKTDTIMGLMPFGGGKSICPGRFFVKYEIKTCVALLLRYFDCKLEDTETIPSQIPSRIGVGIAPPNKDVSIMYRYQN